MHKSLGRLWSTQNKFFLKVRCIGKKTTLSFQIVFNSQIGHHMDPWWQKQSKDVYGDGGSRGDQNMIELKTLKE